MSVEILTKDDLLVFKQDLLTDIKKLMGQAAEQPKEWLKAIEVRQLLKISAGTLQTLRVKRKLAFSKIGGTYYYRYTDIQKMLAGGAF